MMRMVCPAFFKNIVWDGKVFKGAADKIYFGQKPGKID